MWARKEVADYVMFITKEKRWPINWSH